MRWAGKSPIGGVLISIALIATVIIPLSSSSAGGCQGRALRYGHPIRVHGKTSKTFHLCVRGLRRHHRKALLNVRVTPRKRSASIDLRLNNRAGNYVRESNVAKSGATQRIGLAHPLGHIYSARVTSNTNGQSRFHGRVSLGAIPRRDRHIKFRNPVTMPRSGDGEPSIEVDRRKHNKIFVTAPVGIPSAANPIVTGNGSGGVDYWRSADQGHTFHYKNLSVGNGGGDSHVVADGAGGVFVADLAATNINLAKSVNEGRTFTQLPPGGNTTADREWMAVNAQPRQGTGATTLYLSYHDFGTQELWECVGPAGGQINAGCTSITPQNHPRLFTRAAGNTIIGPQVVDRQGRIIMIFGFSTPGENAGNAGTGPIDRLFVARSRDGITWNAYPIKRFKKGTSAANIFPVIDVDRAGNLYAAWSQQGAGKSGHPHGPIKLFMSHSRTHGRTWSDPVKVNQRGVHSAVLPWIVARGNAGKVDVVYVGSSTRHNPNDATANWWAYVAQTHHPLRSHPHFRHSVVTREPVRYGQVCVSGIGCATAGDDGRSLLDFTSVDFDSHGCGVAAIPSSSREAKYPNGFEETTQTLVAHQRAC